MFIPPAFRIEDHAALHNFIEAYGFATLVTCSEGKPFATHIPLLLDRPRSVLLGHVARANPHWELFQAEHESLAIFTGPHAYISPTWYVSNPAVPTWNYTAVHVYGVPRVTSESKTRDIVDATVARYESARENPWLNDIPEEFRASLLKGVVGFEMPIERLEGKFKLGQNRPEADRKGMIEQLRQGDEHARELAEFIGQSRLG